MSTYMVAECVYGGVQDRELALYSPNQAKDQSTSYGDNQSHEGASDYTVGPTEFSERTNISNSNGSNNNTGGNNISNNNHTNINNNISRAKCGRPVFNKTLDLVFKYGERNHFGARSAECMCGKIYGMARSRRLQSHAEVCQAIPHATRQLIIQNAPKEKIDKEQKRQTSRRIHVNRDINKKLSIEHEDKPTVIKIRDDVFNPVNDAIARGIAIGGLSMSMLDNIMIKKSYILLGHTLPDKKIFTDLIIPGITSEIENTMRRELRGSPPKSISIEFDCWKDRFNATLMSVTASLPDGKIYLLKLKDEATAQLTASGILEFLTQTICEYIPYTKINAIMSNLSATCLEVRQKFTDQPGCETVIGSGFLDHVLTLIGYYASNNSYLKARIQEMENILGFMENHANINKKSNENANSNLIDDVATRWYYIGWKMNSISKNKRSLEMKALDDNVQGQVTYSEVRKSILDPDFWNDLEAARVFYEPLCKAISIAESNGSNISGTFNEILSFARLCFETINNPFRNIFLESLVKNFPNMDVELVLACYVLDPRYRSRYLTATAKLMATKRIVCIGHSMGFNDADSLAMFDDYDHYETRTGGYSAYKFSDKNPYEWWRRGPSKTKLKDIACRLSLLRSSSTNIEYLYALLSQSGQRSKSEIPSVENSLRIRLHECKNNLGEDYLSNAFIVHQMLMNCYEQEVVNLQYCESPSDVKDSETGDSIKSPHYVFFNKLVEFSAPEPTSDDKDDSLALTQQQRSSVEDLMEIYKRRFT